MRSIVIAAAILVLTLVACSTNDSSPSQTAVNSPMTVVDPATAGSITGAVVYDGPPAEPTVIDMKSEPACAQSNASPASAQPLIVDSKGNVANAVVYVKDGLGPHHFNPPQAVVALDQRGCVYQPRVVALMADQTLEIHNSDATIHNVHATPRTNGEWNKAQPSGARILQTSFPKPELAIPFMCNVHPWMRAFVFVFDHPFYAITPASGTFHLSNLPPGAYTIEAWQEKLGTQRQQVTLGPHESKRILFRFTSSSGN